MAFDLYPDAELEAAGVTYVTMDKAIASADILSLHVPLLPSTRNLICSETLKKVKRGVVLVNVSRGGLVDTNALIDALLDGRVGAAGLDVYEQASLSVGGVGESFYVRPNEKVSYMEACTRS